MEALSYQIISMHSSKKKKKKFLVSNSFNIYSAGQRIISSSSLKHLAFHLAIQEDRNLAIKAFILLLKYKFCSVF